MKNSTIFKTFFAAASLFASQQIFAQNVGIGTNAPDASAKLDVTASDKGMLIPRVFITDVTLGTPITSPAEGLMIYNTNPAAAGGYGKGFYVWGANSKWYKIVSGDSLTGTLANGKIWIGSAGNVATPQTPTGDVTISNTGVTTIGTGKVTSTNILDGTIATADLANNSVDGSKIQLSSNATGDLMYYDGTDWVRLASGTTGQVLQANGAAAPTWASVGSLTTHTLTNPTNTITSTVNGVAATAPAVNTVGNTSSGNTILTTVNGVVGSTVPIVNSNTLTSSVNTMTNATNGVSANAPIVNSISNTSNANTISTTVNGVAGTAVNIINTNTEVLTKAGGLVSTVNGVAGTQTIPVGTITDIVGFNSTGNPVNQTVSTVLSGSTTHTLTNPTNTITSTVNGVAATAPAVNTVSNTSSVNTLLTTVNGVAGSTVPLVNSNTLSSSVNTMTNATNGVSANAPIVNSNSLSISSGSLVSTVNGVATTTPFDITPAVKANGVGQAGTVAATATPANNYQVWGTDVNGVPAWTSAFNDWTQSSTASTPATKTSNQYVNANVGIGDFSASNPGGLLDVSGSSAGLLRSYFRNNNASGTQRQDIAIGTSGPKYLYIGVDQSTTATGVAASGYLDNRSGGSMYFQNNGANQVVIDGSGNVGIGTISPTAPLHIFSSSSTTLTNGNLLILQPNLSTAANAMIKLGVALSNKNEGDISFNYVGAGSSSNCIGLGFYGNLGQTAQIRADGTTLLLGNTSNLSAAPPTTPPILDLLSGRNSAGALNANQTAADVSFQWGGSGGGYRHFLQTRHNATITSYGNDIDFYVNNSTTSTGSSAPGTGNIQVLTLENNNGGARVGVGTNAPAAALDVNGTTKMGSPGTIFKAIQGGNVSLGTCGSGQCTFTLTFPNAFANVPKVIANAQAQGGSTYNDSFSITVRSVTTTNCVLILQRTDGGSWGQALTANWIAFDN